MDIGIQDTRVHGYRNTGYEGLWFNVIGIQDTRVYGSML